MKITFLAPIQTNKEYRERYKTIIDYLTKSGHTVVHALAVNNETLALWSKDSRKEYFGDFYTRIGTCDLVIAECSLPRVHVGYEMSSAIQQNKAVIVIKIKDTLASFSPLDPLYSHKNIHTYDYSMETLFETLMQAIADWSHKQD